MAHDLSFTASDHYGVRSRCETAGGHSRMKQNGANSADLLGRPVLCSAASEPPELARRGQPADEPEAAPFSVRRCSGGPRPWSGRWTEEKGCGSSSSCPGPPALGHTGAQRAMNQPRANATEVHRGGTTSRSAGETRARAEWNSECRITAGIARGSLENLLPPSAEGRDRDEQTFSSPDWGSRSRGQTSSWRWTRSCHCDTTRE